MMKEITAIVFVAAILILGAIALLKSTHFPKGYDDGEYRCYIKIFGVVIDLYSKVKSEKNTPSNSPSDQSE